MSETERSQPGSASVWALLQTTLRAALGVQDKKHLEQDFEKSSPLPFIIAGIVFTALFVLILVALAVMLFP
jgi:hypothetical protein